MNINTRELVTMAVFGSLWGVVEIGLGSLFHVLDIPMSGTLMAAIGLSIALTGRIFLPRKGSTFFTGVIASILKLFSIGSVVIAPMIGILSEALIAELVLTLFRRPTRPAVLAAGGMGVLYTLLHPFITNPILYGRGIFVIWLDLLDRGARLFGLDSGVWLPIVLGLAGVHLILGILAGWIAWGVGSALRTRFAGSHLMMQNSYKQ